MTKQLLLVDDDMLLRRSLSFSLEKAGYEVKTAATAEDALALTRTYRPGLVLLDIGLPGMDGLDALRYFRDRVGVPVIFLTARRRELDQVLGLESGADDFVTKPFDLDVLLARIKAVLRRTERAANGSTERAPLVAGDLQIDPEAHTATLKGTMLDLTPRQFDLLYALALEAGHVVSVEKLLARVWGAEFVGEPEVVYVHIRWLREKLEEDPQNPSRIVTIRGVGYKLEPRSD